MGQVIDAVARFSECRATDDDVRTTEGWTFTQWLYDYRGSS